VILELGYRSPAALLVAYATQLCKGSVFVETGLPAAVGTALTVRFTVRFAAPPASALALAGVVEWTREAAAGQPAGMAIALPQASEELGAAVDNLALAYARPAVLLRAGEAAPRAILGRYLRSILSCEVMDLDAVAEQAGGAGEDAILQRLDLAVIDLDSSGPGGFELHARLRAHGRAGSAPVLGLAQLERDRASALHAGFDDVLANPPTFGELEAAVLRSLSRPVSAQGR
jgi:CheY-like chemotaxis protein